MTRKRRRKVLCVILALAVFLSVGILGAAAANAPDLRGEWSITANNSRGHINITNQSGSEFSGTVNIDSGRTEKLINGKISGDTITFTRAWDSGTLRQDYTGTLTVSGDGSAAMRGTFSQNGSSSWSWSATKTTPIVVLPTPAPPASGLVSISGAVLNDQLNFNLDGKTAVPVGDDGTPVLPISYNGTTYLPVRAVGYLLGLGIDWDGATNTVLITSTTSKTAPKANAGTKSNTLIPISGALLNGDLKFRLDGKTAVPVGDDGTPVLPISYNGTTYLPVRAIGYLLGLGIDWSGATNTVLITSNKSTATAAGWYFTNCEYIIGSLDFSLVGAVKSKIIGNTGNIWEYYVGTGEKNDFTYTRTRTDDDGTVFKSGDTVTSSTVRMQWTDPPAYFSGTDMPTITVVRTQEGGWGAGRFAVEFDTPYGSTGRGQSFKTPEGVSYLTDAYEGTMKMEKAQAGAAGQQKAIKVYFESYYWLYHYEWRE